MGKRSLFGRAKPRTNEIEEEAAREEIRRTKRGSTPKLNARRGSKGKIAREQKNSIRKLKKKRDGIKEIARVLPQEVRDAKDGRENGEYEGSDAESVYVSKKLLIRQIQKQIAKEVYEGRESVSEYDSWSDLEENFALAYEPIPLSIKMETWRKMTKREILRKVNSQKIRKDFSYLTHEEILEKIAEMQANARYLSQKFGIVHLMPQADNEQTKYPEDEHDRDHDRDNDHNQEDDHDHHGEESATDMETDGNVSDASFISRQDTYLSRTQIIDNIYDKKASPTNSKSSTKFSKVSMSPTGGEVLPRNSGKQQMSSSPPSSAGKSGKGNSKHDSWSSRASSIMKDPESNYVSRVGLLKNMKIFENPKFEEKQQEKAPSKKVHDSWSSRASSIINKANSQVEPVEQIYISRVELLHKIQVKSIEALSAASTGSQSQDSDSDASTVKNGQNNKYLGNSQRSSGSGKSSGSDKSSKTNNPPLPTKNGPSVSQQPSIRAWKNRQQDLEQELERISRASLKSSVADSQRGQNHLGGGNSKEGSYRGRQETVMKEARNKEAIRDHHTNHYEHDDLESDWDSCSCQTCHTCQQTDCSCSEMSMTSRGSNDSDSSTGSVNTVVGIEDYEDEVHNTKDRRQNHYVVNGSEGASSKRSSNKYEAVSNYSRRNKPPSVIEKLSTTASSKRSPEPSSDEGHRSKDERSGPSRNSNKSSKSSLFSWSNELFEKLYEPVSAAELKRKRQMKQLETQLKAIAPDLDRAVSSINTAKRKKVFKQVQNVMTHKMTLEDVSEEDLGKHLDQVLRSALGNNVQDLNIVGHVYVPMERHPTESAKGASRENTDYDTFGSIDSLIFEPKIPTEDAIAEATEEITQSFEYLEQENYSGGHHQNSSHNQHQPDNNNNNNRRNKSGKRLPEIPELYSQHTEQHSRNEKLLANALSVLSESMERRQQVESRNKKGSKNNDGGSSSSKDYGNDNRNSKYHSNRLGNPTPSSVFDPGNRKSSNDRSRSNSDDSSEDHLGKKSGIKSSNHGGTVHNGKVAPQQNPVKNAFAVGKTSFAERVRIFQSLAGKHGDTEEQEQQMFIEDNFLNKVWEGSGRSRSTRTTWKEQAKYKSDSSGKDSVGSSSTKSSNSTIIYNLHNIGDSSQSNASSSTAFYAVNPDSIDSGSVYSRDSSSHMLAGAPQFPTNKIPQEDIKLIRNSKRGKQLDDSVSIYSEFDDSIVRTELVQAQVHISRDKESDVYSGEETESCTCDDCPDCNNISSFKTKNIYHINEAEMNNNNNNNHNMRDRNREKKPPIIPIPPPPPMKDIPLPPPPQVRRGPPLPEPTPPPLPPKSRNSSAKSRMESESSLNIEKKRERKGKIAGDLKSDNESPTPTNTDSFQRRVARSQFRTVSPEPAEQYFDSVEDMRSSQIYRHQLKNQKITHEELLLRVQSISNNPNGGGSGDSNEQHIDNLTLSLLKLGTSEMGDSGISSNLASLSTSGLSPKSDLTDASKDGAVDPADKIIPPGKKRETMLRELKSKLKEKFPNNTLHNSKYNMGIKQAQDSEGLSKRPSDYAHRRKQNEISPGSTLAPVEESDSCDCDSLYECTYNSDGSAQVRSPPPNPPPTSASYRNQSSAATSGRTSAAGRSSRQSTEHSHRLGTPVDKPSHHNLRAGSTTPDALLPARAESRSSIKRRQMRYAENNSPLPPRAATASPAKQRSAGYFRGSSRQLPRTPSGRRENGSRSPDKRSHSSQDRNMKRPDSAKSKETNISGLSIQEKREMVYGPGGVYGPHGPFSTPHVSRYPEPIKKSNQKNSNNHTDGGHQEDNSLTSHGTTESSVVCEDRSDKSQYVVNTVIKTPPAGSPDPHSASRLENYRTQVDASWKESKQNRMMSWITRTQQGSVAAK